MTSIRKSPSGPLIEISTEAGGPLSNVFFVDGGTTVAEEDQDGSIGAPFATLQQAVDLLDWDSEDPQVVNATIFLTPSTGAISYSAEFPTPAVLQRDVAIRSLGIFTQEQQPRPVIDSLVFNSNGGVNLAVEGCEVTSVTGSPRSGCFYGCNVGTFNCPSNIGEGYPGAGFQFYGGATVGNYGIGPVTALGGAIENAFIVGPINAGEGTEAVPLTLKVVQCEFGPGEVIVINGDPGELRMDLFSLAQARRAGATFGIGEGSSMSCIDAPSFDLTNITFDGGTDEVITASVAAANCHAGDTFTGYSNNLPTNAFLGTMRCIVDGTLLIDILCIGTAAADTIDVRVTRFTVSGAEETTP